MKTKRQQSRPWWQLLLLLLACLLGGSSPTLASIDNFANSEYTKVIGSPSLANPYIRVRILFYDADGNDSFFCHNKIEGSNKGPAVYVDDNWICSPDKELAWPDSDKDDGGTGAGIDCYNACANNNGWWGSGYSREIDGIKYTVKFWNPTCTGTDNLGGKRYVDMFVFISKMQVGVTHTVKVKGRWKVHNDKSYTCEVVFKPNATDNRLKLYGLGSLKGLETPTATMSGYGKMKVSGKLNADYGPTTVGTRKNADGKGWTDDLTSYIDPPFSKGIANFSDKELDFSERDNYWDSKSKYVEYIVTNQITYGEQQMPEVKLYQWFKMDVPGFIRAKDMDQNNVTLDEWSKKITITWEADESDSRSKAGTWSVYRNNKLVKSNISLNERSCDDNSSDLEYNTNYTYDVYFVPNNTPQGFDPTESIPELKKSVSAELTPNFTFSNLKASTNYADSIVVTWSHTTINNASEANPYNMIVERSTDKSNWEEKQTIRITDSSIGNQKYKENAKDAGLELFKTYYYRVKINAQGQTFYSGIVTGSLDGKTTITAFTASRGNYTNVVKLKWEVNQVGTSTSYFNVYRRPLGSNKESDWMFIFSTHGTQATYSYDDENTQPGSFNEYKVETWMMDGKERKGGDEFTTDGFSIATGVISGRVTYGTGAAVDGVKVMLKQQGDDGSVASNLHSMRFSADGNGVRYDTTKEEIQSLFKDRDFSVQIYLKPLSKEMNENGKGYLIFDIKNLFGIRLWCNSKDTTYTVGGWIDGSENTNIKIKADEWSQLTFVHSHSPARSYVYVATADTIMKANILNKPLAWSESALKTNCFAIGNTCDLNSTNFRGFVDEFRLFTKALTEKEFERNYNHTLAGNEPGLAIYYPMDEGVASQTMLYDFSKTNNVSNGRHAETVKGANSITVPTDDQLSIMAYTDSIGNYVIRGVPFSGEGTNYSIIPQKGSHDFSPSAQSRYVSQSSLIHSGVDFEDVSSFPVSGKVFYAGTTYPVEGVNFYVDGTICTKDGELIETNNKGEFLISVPIGDHYITLEKNGHVFANNGRYPEDPKNTGKRFTFKEEIKGLEFQDETLVNFTGRVVGGNIEGDKTVGFGESRNNIGISELVLTPLNTDYMMNAKKVITGTSFAYEPETLEKPIASATSKINSTSWRGAGDDDCNHLVIHTDSITGEFSAMLPPLQYTLAPITVVKTGLTVSSAQTVDLTDPRMVSADTLYIDNISTVGNEETIDYTDDGRAYQTYEYNTILKQIYHSSPNFSVSQSDHEDGAFGVKSLKVTDTEGELTVDGIYEISNGEPVYKYRDAAIFQMGESYSFDLKAYEEYKNSDTGKEVVDNVPLADLVVTISNALSDQQPVYIEDGSVNGSDVKAGDVAELLSNQLQLDSLGMATYTWKAGLPNISEPYTRTISMTFNIEGKEYQWNNGGIKGIVLGDMPTGNNFVTSGPDMVDMILRDPPGTGSSAEWTKGTVRNWSSSNLGTWSTEDHAITTSKLGFDASSISGSLPGVAKVNNIESKSDVDFGFTLTIQGEAGSTWSRTIETTKTIATSSDPDFVGDQGDIFIGTATNVIFGKARQLGFHRVGATNEVDLNVDDAITTGIQFETEFSYTQKYIENTLIPNLYALRNSKLNPVSSIEGHEPEGQYPIYLTTIDPSDPKFGLPNNDKAWGTLAKKTPDPEGPSYTMVVPDESKDYQDSVQWYNNQIETWKRHLAFNEREKARAFELRDNKDSLQCINRSFDGGSTVTVSADSTETNGSKYDMQFALSMRLSRTWGHEIAKCGVIFDVGTESSAGYHREHEYSEENKTTFSYTLAEEGDDALTVDIYRYGAYGPIFRTRGGQTSNPYEGEVRSKYYVDDKGTHPVLMEATMQIEVPQIDVDVPTMSDIPTGSAANYTLRLGNISEIGADVAYKLFVLDETNPYGAQLSIDGKVLTTGRMIKVSAGQTLTKTLQLRQTDISVLNYEGNLEENSDLYKKGIGIVFASESQPEDIADTIFIKAYFTPSSSPVDLALSNRTINTQTGTDLTLTFSGFDRNYKGLKAFRLQYKRPGETDWTQIREFVLVKKSPTDNNDVLPATGSTVSFLKNMADDPDGEYLFRCVSASTYGSGEVYRYSEELPLIKDTQRPTPLGLPEPADGVLDMGDDISVTFNEDIVKGSLNMERNFTVTGVLNGSELAHETALSMQNTETAAATEASIILADKDFSVDMWVKLDGAGTILTHGAGDAKMSIASDANGKLLVEFGSKKYTSSKTLPTNKWMFLTLNYANGDEGGRLSATVASDDETVTLFSGQAVDKYEGAGPVVVGKNLSGAIHELLLWDEAHDITTALMNRSKTKSPSTRHLIGYWKMDEGEGTTIRDYARNRHMTMPAETWYLDNENKAVSLDGSHYMAINTSQLQTFEGDDYALEFWMRGSQQTAEAQLVQVGDVALWTNTNGELQLTGKGAYRPVSQMTTLSSASGNILDNAWHHIALNILRQGAAAVYVDGKRVLTTNAANVGSIASNKMIIGAKRTTFSAETGDYSFDRLFKGEVDEVRVWSASINADLLSKNRKVRLTGSESGLAAYYPFETQTLDSYNQVVTLGTAEDLAGSGLVAEQMSLNSEPSALDFTDEAPALRKKPTETNVSFTYTASNEKIVIDIDENPAKIEGCTLNFSVHSVRDENGNYSVPALWSAFVSRKELEWAEDVVSVELPMNTSSSVTATLVNKGGKQQMWTLSGLPSWITVDSEYGQTNPQAETAVTFNVQPSAPLGRHEVTVYATDNNNIDVPLTISVRVAGDEPLWTVNTGDYQETMNIIGRLQILDIPSQDEDDIVGAFIGDECRGVAKLGYVKRYDSYYVTMDIYGNGSESGKKPLEFKVYDASTGIIYPVVHTTLDKADLTLNFVSNDFMGTYKEAVVFNATDEIEQNIDLGQGWNWISFSVKPGTNPEDMNTPVVFAKGGGRVTSVISQASSDRYDEDDEGWLEEMELNNSEMYVAKASEPFTLNVTGHRVNPANEPIALGNGWNWIGYNGLQVMSLADALGDMSPKDGDIIKGQRGVAYYDVYEWIGSLKTLLPGKGYKTRYSGSKPSFTYPAAAAVGAGSRGAHFARVSMPSVFVPVDYHNYPANMVLIAQVVTGNEPVEGVELGVFAGDECREAAVTDEKGMVIITIPGDEPCKLTFRISDGTDIHNVSPYITYETDAVVGTPKAPFVIDLGGTTGIAELQSGRVSDGDVYDLQGRKIDLKDQNRKLRKGVYLINGQKKTVK